MRCGASTRTGTTVFLTTQYLEEADQLCDRLAIIDNGTIVAEGTPEELKSKLGHDVVSVALDGADVAATTAAIGELDGLERVVDGGGHAVAVSARTARARSPRSCAVWMACRSASARSP